MESSWLKENRKNKYDRVGIIIYWELCKQPGFEIFKTWHIYKPKIVIENDTLLDQYRSIIYEEIPERIV